MVSRYYKVMPLPFHVDDRCWMIGKAFLRIDSRLKPKIQNLKSKIYHLKSGFTLIELLVVISIIAILMAVATVSYTNAQQKSRDNKRKSDLKGVQQALELYFQQYGMYPEKDNAGLVKCSGGATGKSWGSAFTCDTTTYMNPLPKDPISTTSTPYYYDSTAPYSTYTISTVIENSKDPDLPQMSGCQALPYNWCVKNP